jgi:hypothetical protein
MADSTFVAMVRELSHDLSVDVITDAALESLAVNFADPEIDAALSGFGAPFVYTAPPTMIRIVRALLVTAIAFDDAFSQTADESRFASAKRSEARKMIDRIRKGEISLGLVTSDPGIDVSDSDLTDRPAEEVFVGSELDWEIPAEGRGL